MIHLILADPFTMMAIGMGATLVGGGVKTFADIRAGQAAGAADTAGADAASKLAFQESQAADVTRYATFRNVADIGLRGGAEGARFRVGTAAGNVAGRTVGDVGGSIRALTQQREREVFAKGTDIAQQEDIKAAQLRYKSGELSTAAGQARVASTYGAVGDVASAIGGAFGVASKWYQTTGDMGGGPTPDYALRGPATPSFLEEG